MAVGEYSDSSAFVLSYFRACDTKLRAYVGFFLVRTTNQNPYHSKPPYPLRYAWVESAVLLKSGKAPPSPLR